MINPAEAVQEWINLVNMDHQDKICRFVLLRLPNTAWEAGENDEIDTFHALLEQEVEPRLMIGMILSIRNVIDYLMDDKGSAEAWNAKIDDMVMTIVNEEYEDEAAKEAAQRKLRHLVHEKMAWIETASSWGKLSRRVLSNRWLHDWERKNLLQEAF